MEKNLLVGNGINIQFGGYDSYSSEAIIKRVLDNIYSERTKLYLPACDKCELLELLEKCRQIITNIKDYKPIEEYLFFQMEIDRISKQYKADTPIEKIGMEDFFICIEYVMEESDSADFLQEIHREFQMLFLDGIYNEGKINSLDYGAKFFDFISGYDNIFTINYDLNLDKYRNDIMHLHGRFDQLAPEYDTSSDYCKRNPDKCKSITMNTAFAHVYSNTIMNWYWLEKYGEWLGKEEIFGIDTFKRMQGEIDIIGMSPCNDEQLFILLNQSEINHVNYYCHKNNGVQEIQKKIKKPITVRSVEKLWNGLIG